MTRVDGRTSTPTILGYFWRNSLRSHATVAIIVVAMLNVAILTSGCGIKDSGSGTSATTGTTGGSQETSIVLNEKLNLASNASSVVVTPPSENAANGNVKAKSFYSVNSDGELNRLQIFGKSGDNSTESDQGEAKDVFFNETFMFFLHSTAPVQNCNLVVRRKSDSKLFCGGSPTDATGLFKTGNRDLIQWDQAGNVYFIELGNNNGSSIKKLDVSDPSNPLKTEIYQTAQGETIDGYLVGASGDVAIVARLSTTRGFIRKVNGGVQNFATASDIRMFIGPSGDFYWVEHGSTKIKKLSRQNDGSFLVTIHGGDGSTNNQNAGFSQFCSTDTEVFSGIVGTMQNPWDSEVFGVYRLIGTPGEIGIYPEGFRSWSKIRCGNDRVYILGMDGVGNGMIRSFKISDGSWSTVLGAGEYTVYAFEINKTGVVYFSGLRNTDGVPVFGRIDSPGAPPSVISNALPRAEKLVPLN